MSYTYEDMETVIGLVSEQRDVTANLMEQNVNWLIKDRDEWKQRALAAEKQLDVVASRFVDLVYTP